MAFTPSHAVRWQTTLRVLAKSKNNPHAALLKRVGQSDRSRPAEAASAAEAVHSTEQPASPEHGNVMRRMAETLKHGEKKTLWQSWGSLSFFSRYMIGLTGFVVGAAGLFVSNYLEVMYPTADPNDKDNPSAVATQRQPSLLRIRTMDRVEDGKKGQGAAGVTA